MRLYILSLIIVLLLPALSSAQDKAKLPAAPPLLSPGALCGKGTFLINLSGKNIGHETFEIKCVASGYAATSQTNVKIPGAVIDVQTMVELDKAAIPTKFTSKGMMALTAVDQTITFKDGIATVATKDGSQDVPYTKGASFSMSNVPYLFIFIAARYDVARGGEQTINIFPNMTAKMERVARDEAPASGEAATYTKPVMFDRYTLKLDQITLILWADTQGRIAVVSLPEQQYVSVLEEYASFVAPLQAMIASQMKTIKTDYSAPPDAPFTAEEVIIKVKNYQLAGTLLLPKAGAGPFPVVVTSTGSGQQTRDEPLPYPNLKDYKLFRQIAEHLAGRGIAVLRVDDRGVGDSSGLETLEKATTFDFADDVRAQVAYLRTRKEIDPKAIAIIGHSEGGVIAPLVAASDPQIAAIVLLAGTAERGDKVLLYQMNYPLEKNTKLTEAAKAKERAEHQRILKIMLEGGDTSRLPPLFRFQWTKTFATYEPLTTIRKVRQPILILQGALDRQVTADQAELLAKAARDSGNNDVTLRVFPNLNHFFLPAKTGDESEYSSLQTGVIGDDVIRAIGDWLQFKLQRGVPGGRR